MWILSYKCWWILSLQYEVNAIRSYMWQVFLFISQSILDKLESLPEFQELLQNLRDKGVDVDHFIELLKALFGLSRRGNFWCLY
jgi:hypothetical protein